MRCQGEFTGDDGVVGDARERWVGDGQVGRRKQRDGTSKGHIDRGETFHARMRSYGQEGWRRGSPRWRIERSGATVGEEE